MLVYMCVMVMSTYHDDALQSIRMIRSLLVGWGGARATNKLQLWLPRKSLILLNLFKLETLKYEISFLSVSSVYLLRSGHEAHPGLVF